MSWSRPSSRNSPRASRDTNEKVNAQTGFGNGRRNPVTNTFPAVTGLARETTSFGVFSNLTSHNRDVSKPTNSSGVDECTVAQAGIQSKMLEAARKGDVATLRRMLYDNTQLQLNFADEDGRTLLHHGIASKQNDIVDLILKKKPPPLDYADKSGDTSLHVAARTGHVMTVHQLLQKGADVNRRNKLTGRTPLHEAVYKQQRHVTELLLYHGADMFARDSDKKSVTELATTGFTGETLDSMVENVNEKRIDIQTFKLSRAVTYNALDVVINVDVKAARNDNVLTIFRREDVDVTSTSVPVHDVEEIASDVVSYNIYGLHEHLKATITMPVFNVTLTSREELAVKTLDGENISPDNVFKNDKTWKCTFRATLKGSGAFVVVCRQKTDVIEVTSLPKIMTSSVDPRVCISIHGNCFMKPGLLSLEILELSDDVEMTEEQVISSTPFYKVQSDQNLTAPLTLQLPDPADYGQESKLAVLLHDGSQWTLVGDKDVVHTETVTCPVRSLPVHAVVTKVKPGADRGSVVAEICHMFSLLETRTFQVCFLYFSNSLEKENKFQVVIECCESKHAETKRKEWLQKGFVEQAPGTGMQLLECPSKRTFTVSFYENSFVKKNGRFFVLSFHPKRTNCVQFEVKLKGKVIQFINGHISVYEGRVNGTNSVDMKALVTMHINLMMSKIGQCQGQTTSTDKISNKPMFERSSTTLGSRSFNNNRPTSERPVTRASDRPQNGQMPQTRQISRSSVTSAGSSRKSAEPTKASQKVDGMEALKKSLMRAANNVDPLSDEQRQKLEEQDEEEAMEESTPTPAEERRPEVDDVITPDDNCKTVFLQDRLLLSILDDLQEEWCKILILLNIPFSQIEEMLISKGDTNRKIAKMFLTWRDSKQSRTDIGLPQLLSALFKGGRRDIANTVQITLRKWHGSTSSTDGQFYKWTTEAYQDSNMLVPTDYPKPMSDPFLVLMSDELSPSLELARALNLEESRVNEVLTANYLLLDCIKTMKLLTIFRDSVPIRIDGLEALISALDRTGNDAMKRYAIMCAKAWVKRTATRKDDPLRYQVDTLMRKLTTG